MGLLPFLWDVAARKMSVSHLAVLVAFNGLLLPAPIPSRHIDPFPLLSPAWSLFSELFVANLLYALLFRWLRGRILGGAIVIAFAALTVAGLSYGSIDMGSLWRTFAGGFARVFFSFLLGVGLQRVHRRHPPLATPAFVILLLLAATFWVRAPAGWSLAYELGCVAVGYPALIYFGASSFESRPALGRLLGNASYALYLVHVPILLIIHRLVVKLAIAPSIGLAAGFVLGSIVVALLIDALFDCSARRLLGALVPEFPLRRR